MTKIVFVPLFIFQIPMIIAVFASPFLFPLETLITYFLIGYVLFLFQMEIGLHRYFAHSSFKTNKIYHNILCFLSTIGMAGPIIGWAHNHVHHHRHSDTHKDPHSPHHIGILRVFFRGWFLYNYNYNSAYSLARRKDKTLAFFEKYYYIVNIIYVSMLLSINWHLIFPLYVFPGLLTVLMPSFVNAFLHKGEEPIDCPKWAFPIMVLMGQPGVANHAQHHVRPSRYHYPKYDLTGFIIKTFLRKDTGKSIIPQSELNKEIQ
tara:strand:- start:339 stop:1121 length:783 start_codon:yes stop_codon:yes gene_type:complete